MLIDKYLFTGFRVHHITFLLLLSIADRNLLIFALLLRNISADLFLHAVRFFDADFFGIVNANFTWNFRGYVITNLFRDGLAYLQVLVSTLLYFLSACNLPFYVGTLLTGNLFTDVSVNIMARLARNIIANHPRGVSTNFDLTTSTVISQCTFLNVVCTYFLDYLIAFSFRFISTNLVTILLWDILALSGRHIMTLLFCNIIANFLGN